MRLRVFGTLVFAALAAIVYAQKVNVDSDRSAPFATYRTYAWTEGTPSPNPLGETRIRAAVDAQLMAKGLMPANGAAPDVFVATHVIAQQRQEVIANGFGYWGLGGGAVVQTYLEGMLVVDLYDANTRKLVWRGVGTDTVSSKPEKNAKHINEAVQKMFEKYPPV